MSLKELREKHAKLVAAAEVALDESVKFINDDKFDEAKSSQEKSDELMTKAEQIAATIKSMEKSAQIKDDGDSGKTHRLPYDDDPADTEPEPAKNTDPKEEKMKSVYVLRYGELDNATKAVISDLYRGDYNQKRDLQKRSFSKYIRYGENRLQPQEADVLTKLILTPETVKHEVAAGFDTSDIAKNTKVQQEAALEQGGVLVPEDFRLDLIKRMQGLTVMRGRARQVNTLRDAVEWPKIDSEDSRYTSQARVTWVDEVPSSATVAETSVSFSSLRVPVHTVMARIDVSLNLLEDSGMDIVDLIAGFFAESMAVDEDEQFLVGSGSGKPEGILSQGTSSEYAPTNGVAAVVSGDASLLTADGLIDLAFGLDAQYLMGAVMIGTKNTFRDIRKLKDGNGDYLWQRGLERGLPPTVLDHDFFMNQALNEIGANTYPVLFGNPRGYLIVDRVGMSVKRVEDATTVGQNKAAIFARRRLGGQLIMPWMWAAQKVAAS